MVLSEPRGLLLFQAVRGGIESVWVFGRRPRPITPRILTLDPIRSEHTDDERSNLSCCRRIAQNGYVVPVQFLGIERLSFLPDSQHDGGNLASQRQACHLRTHTPLLKILQVGAVGFALTAAGRRTDEHFFQTTITIAIQSASGHRFPATYDAAFFHLVLGTHVCDPQPGRCNSTAAAGSESDVAYPPWQRSRRIEPVPVVEWFATGRRPGGSGSPPASLV